MFQNTVALVVGFLLVGAFSGLVASTTTFYVVSMSPCADAETVTGRVAQLYGISPAQRICNVSSRSIGGSCPNVSFSFCGSSGVEDEEYKRSANLAYYFSTLESYVFETILFFENVTWASPITPVPEPVPSPIPTPSPLVKDVISFSANFSDVDSCMSLPETLSQFMGLSSPSSVTVLESHCERSPPSSVFHFSSASASDATTLAVAFWIVGASSTVQLALNMTSVRTPDVSLLTAISTSQLATNDTGLLFSLPISASLTTAEALSFLRRAFEIPYFWESASGGSLVFSAGSEISNGVSASSCLLALQNCGINLSGQNSTPNSRVADWVAAVVVSLFVLGIVAVAVVRKVAARSKSDEGLPLNSEEVR